jgi:hypothetical protein
MAKKLLEAQAGVSVQETEVDRFARDLHAQHGGVDALDQIESIVGTRIQDARAGWRRGQHSTPKIFAPQPCIAARAACTMNPLRLWCARVECSS